MRFLFGDYALDIGRRELRRGPELISTGPQVFDALAFLVRNRDRVVSKDELLGAVWQGRIVSESTLTSHMNAVRKAVGDNGEAQNLIRTVARKGFRFVGEVTEERPPAAARPPTLALPDKPSIVVLPFANLSGDPAQDYFADGMVEEITVALGRLSWLFVIGSRSAFTYKNRTVDVREAGAELGVRYALAGSVRKEGSQVRITAQLADTSHGGQIWADSFQDEIEGIFELQDRIAARVRTQISPALRSGEIERARRKPTANLSAYDLYLRALPIHRKDLAHSREALRLLRQAIGLDPSYGAAYALAAWCYDMQKVFAWVPATDPSLAEGIRLARLAAQTATDDSEALWMTAHALLLLAGEFEQARPLIERAISLNPNSPNAWWVSGDLHSWLGDHDAGIEQAARARRLSPLEPMAFAFWMPTIMSHFFAGRYREALEAADRSLAINPDFPPALRFKVATCGLLGRMEEGRAVMERLLHLCPHLTLTEQRASTAWVWRHDLAGLEAFLKGLRLAGLPE